ncbi:hypothetical protein [uncultured Anaerococcus sp.]|uniref:hypothetical protein n=1 Tax=uncultured Anaerococcus sp. TaxID=293428 RepID=UPI00288BE962|nr:hypothetical protein [uncultured Anaerococcus sp.]
MNKKLRVLSLAMSLALVGPSLAFGAEGDLDIRIKALDREISELESQVEAIEETFSKVNKSSRAYVNKSGRFVSNKEATSQRLIDVSGKLDEYVANVTPSLEQPMLGVYFLNGANLNGVNIRAKNANDLYKYLKGYFVMKDGVNKAAYDELLVDYVNAIAESVTGDNLDKANEVLVEKIKEKSLALELAKAKRKSLLKIRDRSKIDNLKRAISDAETTIAACKQLIDLAPNKVADVRDKLDTLMANQENLIRKGRVLLAKYE